MPQIIFVLAKFLGQLHFLCWAFI